MSKTRIYLVHNQLHGGNSRYERLVRANSRAQAERHVARGAIVARVATQDELVAHIANGIEVAGEDEDEAAE